MSDKNEKDASIHSELQEHPHQWSSRQKLVQLVPLCFVGAMTAFDASSIGPSADAAELYFHIPSLSYLLSNTGFFIAIACGPMLLAPVSESYGRRPVFAYALAFYSLTFIPAALVKNFVGWAVVRGLSGLAASVVNSMVAGTITDLYAPREVGKVMNVYVFVIFFGQAMAPLICGWMSYKVNYAWIWAFQGILTALGTAFYLIFGKETRLSSQMERASGWAGNLAILKRSSSRPFVFLFTEPIVTVLSVWVGFAWGIIFLFTSAVLVVFSSYGLSVPECATFEITVFLGACPGFVLAWALDRAKTKRQVEGQQEPERALLGSCVGGIALALCMLWFGWTARPDIHWVVPGLALVGVNFGIYTIYNGVFSYLAEAYGPFSSSAQASQSFARNVLGGVLPLCAHEMFTSLGTAYACTILASICALFACAPFLLIKYGPALRRQSRAASQIANMEATNAVIESVMIEVAGRESGDV